MPDFDMPITGHIMVWYCQSIHLSVVFLSVHTFIYLSISLSVYTYICLYFCLYVWLAVLLYICVSVCWSIWLINLQKLSLNGCILFKFDLFPKGFRLLQCFNVLFYWVWTLVSSNQIYKMSLLQSYRGCTIIIYFPGVPRCLHRHLQVALRYVYMAYIVWSLKLSFSQCFLCSRLSRCKILAATLVCYLASLWRSSWDYHKYLSPKK